MVMPVRHVGELEEVAAAGGAAVWSTLSDGVRALKDAYCPDGLNLGANLGRSAGAGIPGHFHVHGMPRWNGDTNFLPRSAEPASCRSPCPRPSSGCGRPGHGGTRTALIIASAAPRPGG